MSDAYIISHILALEEDTQKDENARYYGWIMFMMLLDGVPWKSVRRYSTKLCKNRASCPNREECHRAHAEVWLVCPRFLKKKGCVYDLRCNKLHPIFPEEVPRDYCNKSSDEEDASDAVDSYGEFPKWDDELNRSYGRKMFVQLLKGVPWKTVKSFRTKLCKNPITCPNGEECWGAHKVELLMCPRFLNNKGCRNFEARCDKIHPSFPDEVPEDYDSNDEEDASDDESSAEDSAEAYGDAPCDTSEEDGDETNS
jgi:hypothetical protein